MRPYLLRVISVLILIAFTVLGMSLGTQAIANHFGYSSELGSPLFSIGNVHYYVPWRIFAWERALRTGTSIGRIGYSLVLGGLGTGLFCALGLRFVFDKSSRRFTENVFGDAAFAKPEEIKAMGLLGKGRGIILGETDDGQYLRHDGPEHYAVIAPTRSGKGAGIVVPTLLTWRGSCIVYDLKEENFRRTSGKRSEFSEIIYFNPNTLDTAHFNPLLEIRQGIFEVRDAQNLANMIIEPDRPGVQDHWVRTGNSLLTAAILHVLYAAPKGEKNLAGVAALLSRAEKNLTETLLEMLATKHLRDEFGKPLRPHPGVVAAARDVLNKSPDDKSSVASTVMGYLALYRDPLLANATRDSDFTVEELVNSERPKTLYMVIPAGDIDRLRPIIRLMVNLFCRRLTEQPVKGSRDQEHKHKLLLMLDEFPVLGRFEFFETALGFIAGYGLKAMLVAQSLTQIKQVYGERTSLLDNTHVRVFFRPETVDTAEYISKTLGQTTVEYKTRGESGKKGSPFFSNVNESRHFSSRPLLTPREVMELPDNESFVFVGGGKPIRAKKVSYFAKDSALLKFVTSPVSTKRTGFEQTTSVWFEERFMPPEDFEGGEADGNHSYDLEELVVTGNHDTGSHIFGIEGVDQPEALEEDLA